jgi:hypothetical protein
VDPHATIVREVPQLLHRPEVMSLSALLGHAGSGAIPKRQWR